MGFSRKYAKDLNFWSNISVRAVYGGRKPDYIQELRVKATKHVKRGILGIKFKDMKTNNNHMAYRQFLENFENGLENDDEHLILAQNKP
jgi:hypothetical protein